MKRAIINAVPAALTTLFVLPVAVLAQNPNEDSLSRATARQIDIEAIRVTTRPPDINVTGVTTGVAHLEMEQIRRMPALLGEVDVIKAIQMMPGVQMASEGGSGFSVRGGSPDQNLILIDNATVYNPSHLMGFFSVFNNDFVSSVDLYKGDMPMRYGGRLSSLLEVNTLDRHSDRIHGAGGIGLISSRLMLQGPIGKKTSWYVGGRRSYADLFLKAAKDKDVRNSILHFFDLNAKIVHRLSRKDMIQLAGYHGRDAFGMKRELRIWYGNTAASLSWRHIFNARLTSRLTVSMSDYTFGMKATTDGLDAKWDSGVRDYSVRLDFEQEAGRWFNLKYGASASFYEFNPGQAEMQGIEMVPTVGSNALETTAYIANEHPLGQLVTLRYGARVSTFANMGRALVYRYENHVAVDDPTRYSGGEIFHSRVATEPRLGVVVRTGQFSSVKASYARNVQFIQLANNSASGSPLDVWFATGPNIAPQRSHLLSAGYFQNLRDNMITFSAEAYWRTMQGVIDFRDGADLMLNNQLDGEVRTGKGRSYGLELSATKERGKVWTGFINYTLSRSERTIPEINNGKTYAAPYDKTHSINMSVTLFLSPRWELSMNWVCATGNPTTYPVQKLTLDNSVLAYYSDRNAYRFPLYHRADASLTWRPGSGWRDKRGWRGEWNLSVYNLYNRKNPWMIDYYSYHDGSNYAEMTYLFGAVPSITYNFKF
jgi:hypothetical protein